MNWFSLGIFISLSALLDVVLCQTYNPWSDWEACSASCGYGQQTRKRECANGRCVQSQSRSCNLKDCAGAVAGPKYKPWKPWGACSKTCGPGLQKRSRECTNGRCVQNQQKSCFLGRCPDTTSQPRFKQWGEWTQCTKTCGHGERERKRECTTGGCVETQTGSCFVKPCSGGGDGQWQAWTECSVTCGQGTKSRIRVCVDGSCRQEQTSSCYEGKCPVIGPTRVVGEWQAWSACSKSCGIGQMQRVRVCTVGVCRQVERSSCKEKNCPEKIDSDEYTDWGPWNPCSVTCGRGKQTRDRHCLVGTCEEVMTKSCFDILCPDQTISDIFEPWSTWSACSVTCGSGYRQTRRKCKDDACEEIKQQSCYPRECDKTGPPLSEKYLDWTTWSDCSVTCGIGTQARNRRCRVGNCLETATKSCRKPSCSGTPVVEGPQYGPWSDWSSCSTTCGAGEARRTRFFPNGKDEQIQIKHCLEAHCPTSGKDGTYEQWGQWGQCSRSCGTGILTRVRKCKVGTCEDAQTKFCRQEDCQPLDLPVKYSQWQNWGSCSETCGFGFTYRKRYCNVGICEQTESKTCRVKACPSDYTEWEEWGPCSVTCGSGIATRKRYCLVGQCVDTAQTTCDMEKCGPGWEDWGEWKECSKTCGNGFKYRIRKCSEKRPSSRCPGDNYSYERCNTHACDVGVWGVWGPWNDCPVTCGTGTISRMRVCEEGKCVGKDRETEDCNTMECVKAKWGDWSSWSSCSVACGTGEISRTRECIGGKQWDEGCLGAVLDKKECKEPPCVVAKWSKWSKWSKCSVTCGKGKETRQRICVDGSVGDIGCKGSTERERVCNKAKCPVAKWGDWEEWEECSKTCGRGSRKRNRACIDGKVGEKGCMGAGEETSTCNAQKCPPKDKWSKWGDWSECSAKCGEGIIERTRKCEGKPKECNGRGNEAKICQMEACRVEWDDWGEWSFCSATCGEGLIIRTRECKGGNVGEDGCPDEGRLETKICKEEDCKTGGKWSEWKPWSDCSVTCGLGVKSRERSCIDGEVGKAGCPGKSEMVEKCKEEDCPVDACPAIDPQLNSEMTSVKNSTYEVGAQITFKCHFGYKTKGKKTLKCMKGGKWSGTPPYCGAITCERKLTRIEEGRTCKKECKTDKDCEGKESCNCDGWCGKSCFNTESQCEKLAQPENGYIKGDIHKYGYSVTYACNEGYVLTGTATRTCRSDGLWTGTAPKCLSYSTCGQAGDIGTVLYKHSLERIVQGDNAEVAAWPWQALLMRNPSYLVDRTWESMLAGGSVINNKWIITAAHAVFSDYAENTDWKEVFLVGLGITKIPKINTTVPNHVRVFEPGSVYLHPTFDNKNFDYDVALIKLGRRMKVQGQRFVVDKNAKAGEVEFSEYIRPVCLPCMSSCDLPQKSEAVNGVTVKPFEKDSCLKHGKSLNAAGSDVVVTGYGDTDPSIGTEDNIIIPDTLQQALLSIHNTETCINGVNRIRLEYSRARFSERMICTGGDQGRDACQGDSGGPLVRRISSGDGHTCWVQVGIVSWGWGCSNKDKDGVPYPGYYTDVSTVMYWITDIMKKNP